MSVVEAVLQEPGPTHTNGFYQMGGQLVLLSAYYNGINDPVNAKMAMDEAQKFYQRGHIENPYITNDIPQDLGE